MQNEALVVELIICVGILCLTLLHPWVRRVATVGLPLSYVLGLAINYWVGALVHALPWYSSQDPFTKAGFLPVLWGTVAFAIGNFLVAPFLLRMFLHGECSVIPQNPRPQQVRLPLVYVSLGVICFTMLVPVLGSIPSIAAVSVCGISLAVVGVCLASWSAYFQRSYLRLAALLLAICTLPFVTIVTMGFVGYGTAAAVLVLAQFTHALGRASGWKVWAVVVLVVGGGWWWLGGIDSSINPPADWSAVGSVSSDTPNATSPSAPMYWPKPAPRRPWIAPRFTLSAPSWMMDPPRFA